MSAKKYDNASISALKGADRVRLRPSVIFGSDDLEGCKHSFFEILSNSIDEAREGFGQEIKVTVFKDNSLQVEDQGRGIPLDYNEKEQRYNWELVYCELYAGGKYNNNSGENYEFSLGLNGLGACATQYASRFFEVEVKRDGFRYEIAFERGENVTDLKKTTYGGYRTGTRQHWLPDQEVFTDINIPTEYFQEVLKKQAVVNSNIVFKFVDERNNTQETYHYPDGISGYVKELVGEGITDVISFNGEGRGQDRADKPEYRVTASIALAFSDNVSAIEYYHNSSYLEYGGSPDKAVRNALTVEFDRLIRDANKYKSKESKITYSDIEDSLVLVISSFSTMTSYENQTKKAINNKYIQQFLNELIREKIAIWFIENKALAEKVADRILINKRSRENAEKQRLNIRKKLMSNVDNMLNRVGNFVDCRSKDVSKRELYIVEGNSALGSVKMARDSEFQGVIPLRGKILNCLKADYEKIFKSEIITDLLKILGCGVEISSKHNKNHSAFDFSALRWDKIIICTDADVDGFQIRTLILAMLYRLTPTLIERGKVYIAESPLFEITHTVKGKETTYFAYSDAEKNRLVAKLTTGKVNIQRSKGLGENEPEMMWQTTMNPATRRLIKILPEEASYMSEMFDLLLGDNLAGRKEYIANYGGDYMEMLDVV